MAKAKEIRIALGKGTEERFWEKVERGADDDCWQWMAGKRNGYGAFSLDGRLVVAHRVSYQLLKGPVPDGLVLDHVCRNRACVNPGHLEPVTERENILRGEGLAAVCARKTHCDHGHEFTEENTYFRPSMRVERECRICRARSRREWKARNRASAGVSGE